jgi:hypothetical protein
MGNFSSEAFHLYGFTSKSLGNNNMVNPSSIKSAATQHASDSHTSFLVYKIIVRMGSTIMGSIRIRDEGHLYKERKEKGN